MYFSYVPSIIFSLFNRPLLLNLLFKQILIHIIMIFSVFFSVVSQATLRWCDVSFPNVDFLGLFSSLSGFC